MLMTNQQSAKLSQPGVGSFHNPATFVAPQFPSIQPNSRRNAFTIDQYHPLCALATLGFADGRAPFLAGAKLPSKKLSSQRNSPSLSKAPGNRLQASNQIPFSSHRCNRRRQVEGEGKWSGRNRPAAPVCNIHKIPSKHARLDAQGLPRPSRRRFASGNDGSGNSHCSSVNSSCRFFMTETSAVNTPQT